MDPLALVLLAGFAASIFWIWLLGKYSEGTGLERLGLRSARQITETREQLEAEDLEQMLAAHNVRRRARGEREVTVGELELRVAEDAREQHRRREKLLAAREPLRVAEDAREQHRRREDLLAECELDELLAANNARRRARGLPERTPAEVRQELGPNPAAES